jgi:hypothetical protein
MADEATLAVGAAARVDGRRRTTLALALLRFSAHVWLLGYSIFDRDAVD